jgi:hypothetical protein
MQVGSIILSHLYSKALACCCKNTIVKVPPPITIATTAARDSSIIIVIIICVRLQRHYHYIRYIGLGNYDCFFFTKLFLNYLLLLLLLLLSCMYISLEMYSYYNFVDLTSVSFILLLVNFRTPL